MRRVIRDFTRGRVDLAYEDVRQFNYWECRDSRGASISKEEWRNVHERFSDSRHVSQIQPMEGANDCLDQLSARFEIHLATTRLAKARRPTVEWLERHGFSHYNLHFLRHREKHLCLRGIACAVEDDLAQAELFVREHTPCFLLAHPWNATDQETEHLRRLASWEELTSAMLAVAPGQ